MFANSAMRLKIGGLEQSNRLFTLLLIVHNPLVSG